MYMVIAAARNFSIVCFKQVTACGALRDDTNGQWLQL
jgi:hypothetical protein